MMIILKGDLYTCEQYKFGNKSHLQGNILPSNIDFLCLSTADTARNIQFVFYWCCTSIPQNKKGYVKAGSGVYSIIIV